MNHGRSQYNEQTFWWYAGMPELNKLKYDTITNTYLYILYVY